MKRLINRASSRTAVLLGALLVTSAAVPMAAATDSLPSERLEAAGYTARMKLCVSCHGLTGIAKVDGVPHLAGQNQVYLVNQINLYRHGERHGGVSEVMERAVRELSSQNVADIAAWFAAQPRPR